MPPNIPNQQQPDRLDALIRRYLMVDNRLNQEAYDVVQRWYNYINALANSLGNQIRTTQPIGTEAVELAFETPLAGFQGNTFWQQYGQHILPMVQRDIVTHHTLMHFSSYKQDIVFALNVSSTYTFIGLVVSLVQRDGLRSWKNFEKEFRSLMLKTLEDHLNGHSS